MTVTVLGDSRKLAEEIAIYTFSCLRRETVDGVDRRFIQSANNTKSNFVASGYCVCVLVDWLRHFSTCEHHRRRLAMTVTRLIGWRKSNAVMLQAKWMMMTIWLYILAKSTQHVKSIALETQLSRYRSNANTFDNNNNNDVDDIEKKTGSRYYNYNCGECNIIDR